MEAVLDIDCVNEVEGVEFEFSSSGKARYVKVDLDIHPIMGTLLRQNGLVNGSFCQEDDEDEDDDSWLIPTEAVEVDCRNIKWSKKMLRSFEQAKNGQYKRGDINNFWNV